jgi:MOSC domain-containing protein YiiM
MVERRWVRTFTLAGRPGAYLRVVEPGEVRAGDDVSVIHRPAHGVSIAEGFRAWTREPELLPRLLAVPEAPEEMKQAIRERLRV